MPKAIKFLIGLLLLPLCAGAAQALLQVIRASGNADTVWVALLSGAACWLVIFLMLPKPMWVYVVGHELTHVLWVWIFGGRVKKFKATAKGGHVVTTRTNFLIALAPYFFPLYGALVILVFMVGQWIGDWTRHRVWFHLLLGAAYAFHITLTLYVLQNRQSDVTEHGYLFSAVVIWLGNLLVLLAGIPLVTGQVSLEQVCLWIWQGTVDVFTWIGSWRR
ncbi:MAG: hypothetical protein AB1813_15650 [Verrucomicrobiota bacterium]